MKFFVSDLDGTLLTKNEVSLNKNIKNSIYSILDSGNIFAVASGRNYVELKGLFQDFENDIYFICNDGALGIYKEETFFQRPMDKSLFENFRQYTAHGKYVTYIKGGNSLFVRKMMKQYRGHVIMIDSINNISENIYKISDFDKTIPCPLQVIYKNNLMNEYIAPNVNKADAVKFLINDLSISHENTYAFGDNVNDINMFKVCATSIAVANALPKVKKYANKITASIHNEIHNLIK